MIEDRMEIESLFDAAAKECITDKARLAMRLCRLLVADALYEEAGRGRRETMQAARGFLNSCMTADDKAINAEIQALSEAAQRKATQGDLVKRLRAL